MNKNFLTKASFFALQSVIAVSLLVPVDTLAQTAKVPVTSPVPETAKPATTTATTTGAGGSQAGSSGNTFTPLTQIPGVSDIATADSFSSFLNTLYKICIGLGAVLAVLMIMYAGVLIMTSSGSVSSNEKAKSYIQNAILGLVLVLTPTIVFGIINPSILNINIGAEFANLRSKSLKDLDATVGGSDTSSQSSSCDTTKSTYQAVNGLSCSAVKGSTAAAMTCCAGAVEGKSVCCATPKASDTPTSPAKPVTTPKPAATAKYAWQIYFVQKGQSAGFINKYGGSFTTAAACTTDLQAKITEYTKTWDVANATPLCACDKPLTEYPNCPVHE